MAISFGCCVDESQFEYRLIYYSSFNISIILCPTVYRLYSCWMHSVQTMQVHISTFPIEIIGKYVLYNC